MPTKLKVQLLEDSAADAELVLHELRRAGYDPEWKRVETEPEYLAQLDQGWEIILADYNLPEFNGLRALQLLRGHDPDLPFIIVSGTIGEDIAVAAMKAGANDYVTKDRLARLGPVVERELHDAAERRQRKQMAEALRKSEERYRTISRLSLEFAYCCIHAGDDGYTLDWITDAFFTLTGYSAAELHEQRSWLFVSHPDDRKMATQLMYELKVGESASGEFRIVTKDGRVLNILSHMECQADPKADGGSRLFGAVQDITARKQAEERLVSQHALLQAIINSPGNIIVFSLDPNYRYIAFNEKHRREMKAAWNVDIQIGMNLLDCMNIPELRVLAKRSMDRALRGESFSEEQHQPSPDIYYDISWNPVLQGKEVIGISAFMRDITESKKAEARLQETFLGLRNALGGIIQVLSAVSEKRDLYTAGHQRRVANLAQAIAQELGLSPDRAEGIRVAGVIHDIGKMSIPAEILSKPARLSEIEYKMIQSHAQIGHDILGDVKFAWPIAKMILQHHERMDGSGYPQRLKGDDILLESRILAVSDVIEAMASHRPYRSALGIEAALKEIENGKGVLYDPAVVSACLTLFREKGYALKE
jgi:PAS domain S-box-containing protein/putative nucleotidyltransferase with HDIG domain